MASPSPLTWPIWGAALIVGGSLQRAEHDLGTVVRIEERAVLREFRIGPRRDNRGAEAP